MGWLNSRRDELPAPLCWRDAPPGLRVLSTFHSMSCEWDLLVDGNGKYLRIDRVPRQSPIHPRELAELLDFCGEPCSHSSQLRKAPTISHDIALKTIEFLKETN